MVSLENCNLVTIETGGEMVNVCYHNVNWKRRVQFLFDYQFEVRLAVFCRNYFHVMKIAPDCSDININQEMELSGTLMNRIINVKAVIGFNFNCGLAMLFIGSVTFYMYSERSMYGHINRQFHSQT